MNLKEKQYFIKNKNITELEKILKYEYLLINKNLDYNFLFNYVNDLFFIINNYMENKNLKNDLILKNYIIEKYIKRKYDKKNYKDYFKKDLINIIDLIRYDKTEKHLYDLDKMIYYFLIEIIKNYNETLKYYNENEIKKINNHIKKIIFY